MAVQGFETDQLLLQLPLLRWSHLKRVPDRLMEFGQQYALCSQGRTGLALLQQDIV